ncbi:MAG: hypothetical protein ACK4XM_12665 [Chloroherpetonaceae bacterium]
MIFDLKNIKLNVRDKSTTIKGIVTFLVGLLIALLPFAPNFTELDADVYSLLIDYAKYASGAMMLLGLILIGALRHESKDE